MELEILAKYPFLSNSTEYIKEWNFTFDQLINDPDLSNIRDSAVQRITHHIRDFNDQYIEDSLEGEILSFVCCIILLKMVDRPRLTQSFILREAERSEKYLMEESNTDIINNIMQEITDIPNLITRIDDEYNKIPIPIYIQQATQFHTKEWKLVNQNIQDGQVILARKSMIRLLRFMIISYMNDRIDKSPKPDIPKSLSNIILQLRELAKQYTKDIVFKGEYPPCIKHAIDTLNKGENLSHSGRLMLGTFLLKIGVNVQDIAVMFKNAPDYDEKVTLYQLDTLMGGTGTVYECPSCDKLETQNLCHRTVQCNGIYHPLQYKGDNTE